MKIGYTLTQYFDPHTGTFAHGSNLSHEAKKDYVKLADLQVTQNPYESELNGDTWVIFRTLYGKRVIFYTIKKEEA